MRIFYADLITYISSHTSPGSNSEPASSCTRHAAIAGFMLAPEFTGSDPRSMEIIPPCHRWINTNMLLLVRNISEKLNSKRMISRIDYAEIKLATDRKVLPA